MIATADWAPLEQCASDQAGQSVLVWMHDIRAVEPSQNRQQIDGQSRPERTFAHPAGSMTPIP
jgi:hypothetical protein